METEETQRNSTAKIPKKRKISEEGNKIQPKRQFYRRNTEGLLSKTAVQETPAHKQVSHALWCKQDRARKRCRAYTEVNVLEESPVKEIQAGEILPRRSPRKASRVMFQRSHSFYGSSASAGPLTRSRSFTGVRTRVSPKKEPTEASEVLLESKTPQKLTLASVSPLRFSPRRKKRFSLHSLLSTANESDQIIPSNQKSITPTRRYIGTRSSPRLLKKRSFSCIGFTSVPFPGCQQKEFKPLCSEPGAVLPDSESPEISMKIPNNKITEMDECLVLITPIKNPLKSPVHVSSKVVSDTSSCSQVHSQPCGTGSSDRLDWSSCANDENLMTSLENATRPAIRSSPRLFSKGKISDYPKETIGQSLRKYTDAKIVKPLAVASPNSPVDDSVNPKTPLKEYHFNDCVVLLTPIRGPLTSPVHVKSEQINSSVPANDSKSGHPSNVTMNVESSLVTSPNSKSPPSSPQFCLRFSPHKKGKKKSRGPCSSPAETKRLSPLNQILRQQKRKRCFSSSPADKFCKEAVPLHTSATVSKQAQSEKSTHRQGVKELGSLNISCPVVVENDTSWSSGDGNDWLTEMQREYDLTENQAPMSPPTKKQRIHKSVVFGGKSTQKEKKRKRESKTYSLNSDTSFEEEDEVFQSPSVMATSLRRRHANKTPLSASSIKILQESPILYDSKLKVSPSRRIGKCSDPSLNSADHVLTHSLMTRKN